MLCLRGRHGARDACARVPADRIVTTMDPRTVRFEGFERIHLVADVWGSDRLVSSALVIVDVVHRTNPAGVQRIRDFMSSGLRGFATLEEAAEAIAAYTPNRPRRVNQAGLMKVLRQRRDGRWYWHWDPKFLDRGRTEVPPSDFQALFQAAMQSIRVPTLLVRGKLSDVVTEEGVREFLAQIPGAKLVDVGGAAHMVAGDQNDAFSEAVVEFLERDVRPTLRERA